MLELYIANRKADIPENFSVLFNYSSGDISNPTAVKNKYSSSIILPGTPRNNKIFGDIWKLGRLLIPKTTDLQSTNDIGKILVGPNFDPRKRVDFKIYNNSDLIESGYVQLLNIEIGLTEISYRLSLYGGLGDFFYTLQYDEDNIEKNLGSLYWGWLENLEDENSLPLGLWNKDFIQSSWGKLGLSSNGSFDEDITAIPTYSGQYEDFSSSKVLINVPSLSGYYSEASNLFPTTKTEDSKTYELYNSKYALLETPRELSEWEARDLRAPYQRVGLRFSSFFRAISDPQNNGGYNVVLDDDIKETPYYQKSWILLDRPEFSDNGNSSEYSPGFGGSVVSMLDSDSLVNAQLVNPDSSNTFTNTETTKFTVDLGLSLNFISPTSYYYYNPPLFGNLFEYQRADWETYTVYEHSTIWDNLGIRMEMLGSGGTIISASPIYLLYSADNQYRSNAEPGYIPSIGYSAQTTNYLKNIVLSTVNSSYGGSSGSVISIGYDRILDDSWTDNDGVHNRYNITQTSNPLGSSLPGALRLTWENMPVATDYRLVFRFFRIRTTAEYHGKESQNPNTWTWTSQISDYKQWWSSQWDNTESMDYNQVLDYLFRLNQEVYTTETQFSIKSAWFGAETEPTQNLPKTITKGELFASSSNPLKYLLDWTKLFDLKFRVSQYTKTIYIEKRQNYYINSRENLRVDLGRGIKVDPTVAKYKAFSYGLPISETYMSKLYNKKTSEPYGKVKLNTGYEFNNETKDLYEGSVYKALIPYKMNSYYFSHQGSGDLPSVVLSPSYEYTLYTALGNDNLSQTLTSSWSYISSDYGIDYLDPIPKLCIFSDSEGSLDGINSIVFYNGTYQNQDIQISDNLKAMFDLNEGPCYLLSREQDEVIVPTRIPMFLNSYVNPSNPSVYSYSYNFSAPKKEVKNVELDYEYRAPLYYGFWDSYTQDLYNPNGKTIEVYAFLEGKPEDVLRKFWLFDDSLWVIQEIKNYNISDPRSPVQMVLVRVENPTNYLT